MLRTYEYALAFIRKDFESDSSGHTKHNSSFGQKQYLFEAACPLI